MIIIVWLIFILKQEEKINKTVMQKIDYNLDQDNNIILLTGANSGGKTTLLHLKPVSVMNI